MSCRAHPSDQLSHDVLFAHFPQHSAFSSAQPDSEALPPLACCRGLGESVNAEAELREYVNAVRRQHDHLHPA